MQGEGFSPAADPLRAVRRLANSYVIGLMLIVLIAAGTHAIMDRLVAAEQEAAEIVDLAGRQRMLSQRITQLAYRYMLARTPEETATFYGRLAAAVGQMREAHLTLLKHAPSEIYAAAADPVYFGAEHQLDFRVRTFLGAARGILETDPRQLGLDNSYLQFVGERESEPLLDALDLAVQRYVDASGVKNDRLRIALWSLFAALLVTVGLEGLLIFRPAFARLMVATLDLHDMARTDPLTGSHNRRSFVALAEAEHERVKRYGERCAVLMFDIDHFKRVNDTHGHHVGDLVIQAMAAACVDGLRKSDVFGRLGGEEFAALLPTVGVEDGLVVAEKLRALLEATVVEVGADEPLRVTVSVGVSTLEADDESPFDGLNRADENLYRAKEAGRNRVVGPD